MTIKRALATFFLLLASTAMLGQGDNARYFAISTQHTFASGGTPSVNVSAYNVSSLQFRVYRVNDAEKFFKHLEDPHRFGGSAPVPRHEKTPLETFHTWKRNLRTNLRLALRAQFSESPSEHLAGKPAANTKVTEYAEVPVLNQQQLVLSFVHAVKGKNRWEGEQVEVKVPERGIYLVEAVDKDLRAYTVLIVSDLVMVSKVANGRIVNIVMDRNTGQPVPSVPVVALVKGSELARGDTNADGIAELKGAPPRREPITIIAGRDRNVAVSSFETWNNGPNGENWMGYVYTDRPVYRPGHTVHFKALLRLSTLDGYKVPTGREVPVEVRGADGKIIYRKTLKVSDNGTLHDELTLNKDAPLGFYYVRVKAGGGGGDEDGEAYLGDDFEVQEYKKPEYEVRVTPGKARVLQGATVPVTIDAQYFFGEPVSGASVKYSVFRQPYWSGLWDQDPDAEPSNGEDSDSGPDDGGDQLTDQTGTLDKDGKLTIQVPAAINEKKRDVRYRIQVGVTDAANREITGNGWIVATYGSFALNVAPDRYVYAPGSTGTFTIEARDYEHHPVRTRAHVELLRTKWREEPVVVTAQDVDLGAEASAKVDFKIPAEGGSFEVRATAKTPEGREIESRSYVWVYGGAWAFDESRGQTVQMMTDKKKYRAGDTATVLVVAGEPNTAVYVSVEGGDVRKLTLLRAKESTVSFEVPITAKDEPGIQVSATYVRKGVLYTGTKLLRIPPVEHELKVNVSTDKPQYLPGQSAEYSIDVTGGDGKPVPRAEFSLGVVDEAIYGVRKDTTPNILTYFYGDAYNRVLTESSLDYNFYGESGRRRMQLAALRPASRLAQLKPERLVQPKVRKNFPDTTYWATDIVTDNAGHAHAKVEFPDSLTTWRATARGITPDTRVGAATLKTIVRKNLILRLSVPRFFVQGDEVVIAALVHNYLKDAKTARVSLDVKGLDVLDGATRDVAIASRSEAKVEWRVRAQQTRSATITGKALTNEESDAVELELPVNIPGVKMSVPKGGSMPAANGAASFDLAFPESVEPGSRSISIRLAPSVAGSLFGALEYLTAFPYGCVEQTMSSFLPNIIVKEAITSLDLKVKLDEDKLHDKIHAGLERLNNFQHEDGGWGWWQTDESHPFMTAYVVAGFTQARGAGVDEVDQARIDRGAAWLVKKLKDDPKLASDLRAYMVYALSVAGKADAASIDEIYSRRSKLSPYGLALLGLTLEQAKDARAAEIATALEKSAKQDDEQAWWPASRDEMLDFGADVTPEATAYIAKFLAHEKKDSPLLPKAAFWLMMYRNEGEWWESTKQTAMVIYGLVDYLKVSNELKPDFAATVYVNDKIALTRKFDGSTDLNTPDFVLNESKLLPGVNKIRVTSSGSGRVYYSIRGEYYTSDPRAEKQGSVSLNLLRDYFTLVPGKKGDHIVYDLKPLDHAVSPGDVLAVRLTVTGSDWKYLLIEDPIPAGTEFIERDQAYELRERPPWWQYDYTRRELHDDRMAIFQEYFSPGQQQFFYLLKVVNPGVFQVSPAKVGPMYQPSVMSTTEKRRLEVK